MTHIPVKVEHHDSPAVILSAGLAMLALLFGVIVGVVRLTDRPQGDGDAFCLGWTNGLAYGLYTLGADAAIATDPTQAPTCPPSRATRPDPREAWCEGFAQAYARVGIKAGYEPPPEGIDAFVVDFIPGCLAGGMPENPPVPGTEVGSGGSFNLHD